MSPQRDSIHYPCVEVATDPSRRTVELPGHRPAFPNRRPHILHLCPSWATVRLTTRSHRQPSPRL